MTKKETKAEKIVKLTDEEIAEVKGGARPSKRGHSRAIGKGGREVLDDGTEDGSGLAGEDS